MNRRSLFGFLASAPLLLIKGTPAAALGTDTSKTIAAMMSERIGTQLAGTSVGLGGQLAICALQVRAEDLDFIAARAFDPEETALIFGVSA